MHVQRIKQPVCPSVCCQFISIEINLEIVMRLTCKNLPPVASRHLTRATNISYYLCIPNGADAGILVVGFVGRLRVKLSRARSLSIKNRTHFRVCIDLSVR